MRIRAGFDQSASLLAEANPECFSKMAAMHTEDFQQGLSAQGGDRLPLPGLNPSLCCSACRLLHQHGWLPW